MSGAKDQHIATKGNKDAGNSDDNSKHITHLNKSFPSQFSYRPASISSTVGMNPTFGVIAPIPIQQYAVGPIALSSGIQLAASSLPPSFSTRSEGSGGCAQVSHYLPGLPPSANGAAKSRTITRIQTPHPHDVLCGRGGGINSHPGNKTFRDWVRDRKESYNLATSKAEKARISNEIISKVQKLRPPGRFLMREDMTTSAGTPTPALSHAGSFGCGSTGWWIEIDDTKAVAKTSQALREGAPTIRAQHKDSDDRFGLPGSFSSKVLITSQDNTVSPKASTPLPVLSQAGLPISAEALNSLSKEQLKNQANEAVRAVAELRQSHKMLQRTKLPINNANAVASFATAGEPFDYSSLSASNATQALAAAVAQTHVLGPMQYTRPKVGGSDMYPNSTIAISPNDRYSERLVSLPKFAEKRRAHPHFTSNINFSKTTVNELAESLEPLLKVRKQKEFDDVAVAAHSSTTFPTGKVTPTPPLLNNTGDTSACGIQTKLDLQTLHPLNTALVPRQSTCVVSDRPSSPKKQLANNVSPSDDGTRSYTRAHSLALSESSGLEGLNEEDFTDPFQDEEQNLHAVALAVAARKAAIEKDAAEEALFRSISDAFESLSSPSTARQSDTSTCSLQSDGTPQRPYRLLRNVSSACVSENSSFSVNNRRDSGDSPENENCRKGDTTGDKPKIVRSSSFKQHGLGSRNNYFNRSVSFSDSSASQNSRTTKNNSYGRHGNEGRYSDQSSRRNIVSAH